MIKRCEACKTLTPHTVSGMDSRGHRMISCDKCSSSTKKKTQADRARYEKKRAERYPDDEKSFNDVVRKVSTSIPRISLED